MCQSMYVSLNRMDETKAASSYPVPRNVAPRGTTAGPYQTAPLPYDPNYHVQVTCPPAITAPYVGHYPGPTIDVQAYPPARSSTHNYVGHQSHDRNRHNHLEQTPSSRLAPQHPSPSPQNTDTSTRHIKITNLPAGYRKKNVLKILDHFAKVDVSSVQPQRDNRSTVRNVTAYATFKQRSAAYDAVKTLNGNRLEGRIVGAFFIREEDTVPADRHKEPTRTTTNRQASNDKGKKEQGEKEKTFGPLVVDGAKSTRRRYKPRRGSPALSDASESEDDQDSDSDSRSESSESERDNRLGQAGK